MLPSKLLDIIPDSFEGPDGIFGTFRNSDRCFMISKAVFAFSTSALPSKLLVSAAICLKDRKSVSAGAVVKSHWEQVP